MTSNLDGKIWSGHMIEPLAAAPAGDWRNAVDEVLLARAGFAPESIGAIEPALSYYTAPAELNERVQSVYVEIKGPAEHDRPSNAHYSGFSHDGSIRSHEALRLLPAIQVGMLAEARLELNLYNLLRRFTSPSAHGSAAASSQANPSWRIRAGSMRLSRLQKTIESSARSRMAPGG